MKNKIKKKKEEKYLTRCFLLPRRIPQHQTVRCLEKKHRKRRRGKELFSVKYVRILVLNFFSAV